jgi:predicted phage tail component-like protein
MAYDTDFIGFTYNGKHCITNFNIYRVSDGERYNDNIIPTMTDKTVDVPGSDGQYFFDTKHKTKQFSVSVAFDNVTEAQYRAMREWLDGKGIHDLIFDEAPYKVYSAKVTGTPQLKTICFEESG